MTEKELTDSGVMKIHPDFRIVAIAEPPTHQTGVGANWLSPEVLSLFIFHEARILSKEEEMYIITSKVTKSSLLLFLFTTYFLLVWTYFKTNA